MTNPLGSLESGTGGSEVFRGNKARLLSRNTVCSRLQGGDSPVQGDDVRIFGGKE